MIQINSTSSIRRRIWQIATLCFVLSAFWACEENPEAVNLNDSNAELVTDTLYATSDVTFVRSRESLTTLSTSKLLIGNFADITCRPLMRFISLPESIAVFDSAFIELKTGRFIGDAMATGFTVTAYPITEEWVADTSAIWRDNDFNSNIDIAQPLGEFTLAPEDSQIVRMRLNQTGLNFFQGWADTSSGIDNHGMGFGFNSANFMVEILARDLSGSSGPTLYLHYTDSIPKVDTLLVGLDVYLDEGQVPTQPNRIYTSTLRSSYVSLMKFNVGSLWSDYPDGVIVESAALELSIDGDDSFYDTGFLELLPLADSSGFTSDNYTINNDYLNSIGSEILLTRFNADSTRLLNASETEERELAANYIQPLLNDSTTFAGFYISDFSPTATLRKFSFYRFNDADISKRPRLILRLLKLPQERL